ncbi:MAG: D-alanine--D-alanine ligase [Ignavibacteria bacterium]|nr:D-alanine--D-alanine ligase [Ignavibacteria bacterium]
MEKIRLGVLFGGRSGEHEVSLVSAASVMQALDPARFIVIPIGIAKSGAWLTGPDVLAHLNGAERSEGVADCFLPPDPTRHGLLVCHGEGAFENIALDAVFPVLHGTCGEDGTIQGLLELAELPYVGSGVLASALGMDKALQKRVHVQSGLPVVPFASFSGKAWLEKPDEIIRYLEDALGYPVFVKPPNLGSSVGISKARTREELIVAVDLARGYDRTVIVEQSVENAREIEVAVLGNEAPIASMPGEIVPSNEFYDYNAKYVDGASATLIPAELPEGIGEQVRALAIAAYKAIGCEGMARVDFLVTRDLAHIVLNEVNTIPGFTSISMYPKLFEAAGIPYTELLSRLVDLALERHAEKSALLRSYDPGTDWHRGV